MITIPIQGTFDIARGRTSLRTHLASNRWHPTVHARANALLTALGELILFAAPGTTVSVQVEIQRNGAESMLWFSCELKLVEQSAAQPDRISKYLGQLERTSDSLKVNRSSSKLQIEAVLRADRNEKV